MTDAASAPNHQNPPGPDRIAGAARGKFAWCLRGGQQGTLITASTAEVVVTTTNSLPTRSPAVDPAAPPEYSWPVLDAPLLAGIMLHIVGCDACPRRKQ